MWGGRSSRDRSLHSPAVDAAVGWWGHGRVQNGPHPEPFPNLRVEGLVSVSSKTLTMTDL